MKTAVSIPDELFEAADRLARQRKMSRSALCADALRLLLAEHEHDAVTAALDAVYADTDDTLDPAISAEQAATLREEW